MEYWVSLRKLEHAAARKELQGSEEAIQKYIMENTEGTKEVDAVQLAKRQSCG